MTNAAAKELALDLGRYQLGWSDVEMSDYKAEKGLTESVVRSISEMKGEPEWMLAFRLRALRLFQKRPMAAWFAEQMPGLDFDDIYYYVKPAGGRVESWEELPDAIRSTYEKLGIPEAERKYLAGVTAQYDSEAVFHRNRADLESQGVIFTDMDTALREWPDLVRKHFATVVPPNDNKFAALNSAVWSGGSFIYVPPGVRVDQPLQAYFRINAKNMGQFERTLIIADEGAEVSYIEGCSAPVYSSDSLHSAVVELVAAPGAKINYTTIQNWSNNVYNLVTKRARAEESAHVAWVDVNVGSRLTMKYPSVFLMGPQASGEVLSVAFAGDGQIQDTGAKMIHVGRETTSSIVAKSISTRGGKSTYRGLVHVDERAQGARSFVRCDALLLDDSSLSKTLPYMEISGSKAEIGHEATVSRVAQDQLFYLMSRGLSENQAMGTIVNGFTEPVARKLPMEFAVEFTRLIELGVEGAIG